MTTMKKMSIAMVSEIRRASMKTMVRMNGIMKKQMKYAETELPPPGMRSCDGARRETMGHECNDYVRFPRRETDDR